MDCRRALLVGAALLPLLPLGLGGCVRVGFGVEGAAAPGDGAADFPVDDAQGGIDGRADGPHTGGPDAGDAGTPVAEAGPGKPWVPITVGTTTGVPGPRRMHTYVWTGKTGSSNSADRLIVWGGENSGTALDSGGIYHPASKQWTSMSTTEAPAARRWHMHTPIWTGATGSGATAFRLIVWGGDVPGGAHLNSGGIYDPAKDQWKAISVVDAPDARTGFSAVWAGTSSSTTTGHKLVIWGGVVGGSKNTGGIYDPATDQWKATSLTSAPQHRCYHTGVWTGATGATKTADKMLVWGGIVGAAGNRITTNTGGIFDLATNSWKAISTNNAPTRRRWHTAIWTGATGNPKTAHRMIVWGGIGDKDTPDYNTGGIYDPATDSWKATSTKSAPSARWDHRAVWTGSQMLIWKGASKTAGGASGGAYDPASDSWTPLSASGATAIYRYHGLVWTGTHLLEWGGDLGGGAGQSNAGAMLAYP